MKSIITYLFLCGLPLASVAQAKTPPATDTPRQTEHQWTYGVGHIDVLDTYLSPLTYDGTALSVWHRSERLAHWGKGKVTVQGNFGGHVAFIATPADDDKAWDGFFKAGVAWHYNWHPAKGLRLAAGIMGNLGTGFTYMLKNSNNPAQARLSADLGFSGIVAQDFRLWKYPIQFRAQMDIPLLGAMFTPNYGQSYYEIFSLGHYDKNIRCTHPFNAPSATWETTFRFPIAGATLTLGYRGDIRQSDVNQLKQHSWNHSFVIGYVRQLHIIRNKMK